MVSFLPHPIQNKTFVLSCDVSHTVARVKSLVLHILHDIGRGTTSSDSGSDPLTSGSRSHSRYVHRSHSHVTDLISKATGLIPRSLDSFPRS